MPVSPHARMARERLAAQHIARPSLHAVEHVVARLGAVQAQDYAACKWAVGLRLAPRGVTEAAFDEALARGAILRSHALRWTWQLVSAPDLRWMLGLVAPRLLARYATYHRAMGLDAAAFRRSATALEKALSGGRHLTREELAAILTRARVAVDGYRLSHVLGHAEMEGLLCSGAPRGKAVTYALLDERVPPTPAFTRDQALAELAARYFKSRGPATVADFTWWSGLTAREARAALAMVQSSLASRVADARTYWFAEDATPAPSKLAYLLPAFDEYLVAYQDRGAVLDPRHVKRINAGGGFLSPSVVLGGRVIGTWRRALTKDSVSIALDLFVPLAARDRSALVKAARRYAAFLGRTPEVHLAVRGGRATVLHPAR